MEKYWEDLNFSLNNETEEQIKKMMTKLVNLSDGFFSYSIFRTKEKTYSVSLIFMNQTIGFFRLSNEETFCSIMADSESITSETFVSKKENCVKQVLSNFTKSKEVIQFLRDIYARYYKTI